MVLLVLCYRRFTTYNTLFNNEAMRSPKSTKSVGEFDIFKGVDKDGRGQWKG